MDKTDILKSVAEDLVEERAYVDNIYLYRMKDCEEGEGRAR